MSTQHPDNVTSPFFAKNHELGGEDEITEAFYAFSHLGCDEQMWDCEGKEADTYVVKKLLNSYGHFFRQKKLGEDLFITLRVPNPSIEKAEAKILLETLESIPRSHDAARLFYNSDTPPIFEVILPMTTSAKAVDRLHRYYSEFVIGKQHRSFSPGDITIAEWIGEFKPETINVIPLVEDMEHLLCVDLITKEYLRDKKVPYQRVFLARSDPAMNYGLVSAVLLNKIALMKLHRLSGELGIPLYPIVGAGSSPFRGNLRPPRVGRVLSEYPSAQTLTLQSAFKYDYPSEEVQGAIGNIYATPRSLPLVVDENRCISLMNNYCKEYQRQVKELAKVINDVARAVPSRRRRKLHIGLYGYSRDLDGVKLPRAIKFCAALYSIGVPPELLGLNALSLDDLSFLRKVYVNFDADIQEAVQYCNMESPFLPPPVRSILSQFWSPPHEEHQKATSDAISALHNQESDQLTEAVLRAANARRFLG